MVEPTATSDQSKPSYTIRPATKEDVPAILYLIKGLAEYEKLPQEVENTVEQLTDDGFGAHPVYFASVVQLTDHSLQQHLQQHSDQQQYHGIIGFALCFYAYSTWKGRCLYLEDLYIDPNYRKGGIGMNVFRYIVEDAKKRKCYRVMWQALDWNQPARDFYQKLGSLETPEWMSIRLTADRIDAFIDKFGTYTNPK